MGSWPPRCSSATVGLRIYLSYITRTGYTYGALATPIAFLLFAFFLGFAIMIGAELNAAIDEEMAGPDSEGHKLRTWLRYKARSLRNRDGNAAHGRRRQEHPEVEPTGGLAPGQPSEGVVDPLAVRADR